MRDFENWYAYYLTNNGFLDREIALKGYNEYFNCTCDTCMYRKEKGTIPFKLGAGCNAPTNPEGVNDVIKRLLSEVQT